MDVSDTVGLWMNAFVTLQMIYNQFVSCVSSYIWTNPANSLIVLSFPAVCQGIANRLNLLGSREDHYLNMVKTYSNCTVVLENLEVTYMEEHHDLSFLSVKTLLAAEAKCAHNRREKFPIISLVVWIQFARQSVLHLRELFPALIASVQIIKISGERVHSDRWFSAFVTLWLEVCLNPSCNDKVVNTGQMWRGTTHTHMRACTHKHRITYSQQMSCSSFKDW